jgi:threonine/homoserine/homoserine lactone efflux protein
MELWNLLMVVGAIVLPLWLAWLLLRRGDRHGSSQKDAPRRWL